MVFYCGFWLIDYLMNQKEKHREQTKREAHVCCGKPMSYVHTNAGYSFYVCEKCLKSIIIEEELKKNE